MKREVNFSILFSLSQNGPWKPWPDWMCRLTIGLWYFILVGSLAMSGRWYIFNFILLLLGPLLAQPRFCHCRCRWRAGWVAPEELSALVVVWETASNLWMLLTWELTESSSAWSMMNGTTSSATRTGPLPHVMTTMLAWCCLVPGQNLNQSKKVSRSRYSRKFFQWFYWFSIGGDSGLGRDRPWFLKPRFTLCSFTDSLSIPQPCFLKQWFTLCTLTDSFPDFLIPEFTQV